MFFSTSTKPRWYLTKILTHIETFALIAKFSKYMLNAHPCLVIGSCEIRFLLIIFASNTLNRVIVVTVATLPTLFCYQKIVFVYFWVNSYKIFTNTSRNLNLQNEDVLRVWGNNNSMLSIFLHLYLQDDTISWNSNQMMLCPTEMGVLCWMNRCRGESKACIAHWSNPFWAPNLGRQLSPPIKTET